ncbi:MAG: hypothetical protein K2H65_03535, partial [Bacteroidales bacterium]|nr:hypothetical protein [Bacteroidales bacterium]
MRSGFRLLVAGFVWTAACASLGAQDRYAIDWQEAWHGSGGTSVSENLYAWSAAKPTPAADTLPRPKNTMSAKEMRKAMTFAERNSGAFRTKKHGGVRSPGMAALCSAVVPGLGQCYNAQWYKPPVIYAGAAVIAYFVDFNLKEKRIYEREIDKRYYKADASICNPELAGQTYDELLRLRNYYEQNF